MTSRYQSLSAGVCAQRHGPLAWRHRSQERSTRRESQGKANWTRYTTGRADAQLALPSKALRKRTDESLYRVLWGQFSVTLGFPHVSTDSDLTAFRRGLKSNPVGDSAPDHRRETLERGHKALEGMK